MNTAELPLVIGVNVVDTSSVVELIDDMNASVAAVVSTSED